MWRGSVGLKLASKNPGRVSRTRIVTSGNSRISSGVSIPGLLLARSLAVKRGATRGLEVGVGVVHSQRLSPTWLARGLLGGRPLLAFHDGASCAALRPGGGRLGRVDDLGAA